MKPKKKLSDLDWRILSFRPIGWNREMDHHIATVDVAALPTRLMTGLMYLQHMHKLPYHTTSMIK